MRKFVATAALVAMMLPLPLNVSARRSVGFYKKLARKLEIIRVYDPDELDYDTLVNRDGDIIIERTIGVVKNKKRDGKILNTKDKYYNYINYKKVKGAKKGDIILTYSIYNPESDYEDDIMCRYDYIIDRPSKK